MTIFFNQSAGFTKMLASCLSMRLKSVTSWKILLRNMAAKTFVRIVLTRKNSISSKTLEPSLKLRQNSTSNTFNQFFHYELNLKVFKSSSNPEPFTVISSSIKILICFDKIRWEKARSIDLSEHVKSILYC